MEREMDMYMEVAGGGEVVSPLNPSTRVSKGCALLCVVYERVRGAQHNPRHGMAWLELSPRLRSTTVVLNPMRVIVVLL